MFSGWLIWVTFHSLALLSLFLCVFVHFEVFFPSNTGQTFRGCKKNCELLWKSDGNFGGLKGARRIYLHIYSLVQWVPIANLNNDDNKWACEMSFFENYVPQYPPFCDGERWFFGWWDVMEVIWSDPDSAGFRDSHYSQIKCRWLDAASSSIFSLFPHLKLHFNSSYFINIFFPVLTQIFPSCNNQRKFFPHTRALVLYVEYYS